MNKEWKLIAVPDYCSKCGKFGKVNILDDGNRLCDKCLGTQKKT